MKRDATVLGVGEGMKVHYPLFDVFRILLALEVVRGHITREGFIIAPVPAFLAISGFCVLQSYQFSRGWPHFAWKRCLRLVPALVAILAFIAWRFGPEASWGVVRQWATLGLGKGSFNNPVWSLGWEELYYGLLAVLYSIGVYKRPWVIWAVLGVSLVVAALLLPLASSDTQRAMALLAPSFFIGNLCYLYRENLPRFRHLSVPMVGLSVYAYMEMRAPILSCVLITVGLLLCAIGYRPKLWKLPDISYSAYIYHAPVLNAFGRTSTTVAIILAVCVVSFYVIEKPALALKDWTLRRKETAPTLERAEAATA